MGAPARILSPRVNFHAIIFYAIVLYAISLTVMFASSTAWAQAGACVGGPCVATYHNDPARDGVQAQESFLSPSLFPSQSTANFGLLVPTAGGATGAVDGLIYAQPLYLSNVTMASASCTGSQNIVLVATENNSIYAFTWTYSLTSTGYSFLLTQCWTLNLNQPGEYAMPFTALPVDNAHAPCNNLVPQSGITSTPVVDTTVTSPVMYVVSAHQTINLTYTYRLHAINVNTGTEVLNGSSAPMDLSAAFHTGITANMQNQRPGLALYDTAAGTANIYVGFGSFCDTPPYSGYMAGLTYNYSTQSFAPVGTNWSFDTENGSTKHEGGIWMGGAAPGVDSAGNVYFSVANGNWNGTTEFGESVVKLATTSTGLVPVDYYTPNDYAELNLDKTTETVCSGYGLGECPTGNTLTLAAPTGDFDLGSGGVTMISPAGVTSPVCGSNGELVAGGKEGVIYGVCISTESDGALESIMGGLDGCGYDCSTPSNATVSACTEADLPGNGAIAQCFQGANAGETQKNGSTDVFASPGMRGTEAFWAGTASNPENYLYVSGSNAPLIAYQANVTTGTFSPVGAPAKVPGAFEYPGVVPAISWDGADSDTALLWVLNVQGYGQWQSVQAVSQAAKPAVLIVYNAIPTVKKPSLTQLWESSVGTADTGPGAVKFTVPTVAGGLVFIGGGTPGYAPGPPGGKNVNCTASALADTTTPVVCGGMLAVYGKIHS